jgi:hypothetical protein
MLDDFKATSDHGRRRSLLEMNHIIRHQSVPPENQIQRTFTFPDPTFSQDQDADSVNIHEHTVDAAGGSELLF